MAAAPPDKTSGVIHDIGYRHYTGERLGRWPVVRSLYLDSLRGAFGLGRSAKSKIAPFLLLAIVCVPALAIAIIVNIAPTSELPFPLPHYASFVYVVVCLYVAGQAPASVSRDLRFRTTSLYFSRPLRRDDYVGAKLAALTTAVAAVLTLPLLVLSAGALLSDIPSGTTLRSLAEALLGVVLLAPMLAGIGLALASVTPRRGMGIAAVTAVLILLWGIQGTVYGLTITEGSQAAAYWTTLISPGTVVDSVMAWVFGIEPASGASPDGPVGLLWVAAVVLVVLGAAAFLRARYAKVSVS